MWRVPSPCPPNPCPASGQRVGPSQTDGPPPQPPPHPPCQADIYMLSGRPAYPRRRIPGTAPRRPARPQPAPAKVEFRPCPCSRPCRPLTSASYRHCWQSVASFFPPSDPQMQGRGRHQVRGMSVRGTVAWRARMSSTRERMQLRRSQPPPIFCALV